MEPVPAMRANILFLVAAAIASILGTVSFQALESLLSAKDKNFEFIDCNGSSMEDRYSPTPCSAVRYLEYKADGSVWARWPNGRFLEVVPKTGAAP
jgi:hypothetical protein